MNYQKRIRVFALSSMALAGLVLLVPHIIQGFTWPDVMTPLTYVVIFLTFITLVFPPPPPQKERSEFTEKGGSEGGEIEMVTSIACYDNGCHHVYGRLFRKGDYVRKMVGRCPRCGGELYVRAIFVPSLRIGKAD